MKASQVGVKPFSEEEHIVYHKCVICRENTLGWGKVGGGYVCSAKCQREYNELKKFMVDIPAALNASHAVKPLPENAT